MISGEMAYSSALNAEARFISRGKDQFWKNLRRFSGSGEEENECDLLGVLCIGGGV